ncbi:MAG: DUF2892 domain-containing protein [Deltaproteobacteria bacterium]|nr:DUF2892 domain-containing protein [Deltaproteobacteria bacterium]
MTKQIKIHDGVVGALVLASVALGWFVDPRWLALTALTALVMISSAFTGFCPVHYTVGKVVKP